MDFFYDNKRIGSLKEGVFRKRVQKSKHRMRNTDSWGIQYEAVKKLMEQKCHTVRILETEENIIYTVPLEKIWKEGRVENWGDGDQVFLPRSQWDTEVFVSK